MKIRSKKRLLFLALIFSLSSFAQQEKIKLESIILHVDKKILNPVLNPGQFAVLSIKGMLTNGRMIDLPQGSVVYSAKNKLASGDSSVLIIKGNKAYPAEGGAATVLAVLQNGEQTLTASTQIIVRPYYRDYHQALVMKLMMGMEGEPVERLIKEPLFLNKKHDMLYTFEEALELIRKADQLTMGIPKIIYLVGWQKGGHDHLYPAWTEVNPGMKREQDSTALQSLRWLIREGRKYHTTVSLHINMVDAYKSSPLWNEYVEKDIIAKDENGQIISTGIQIQGDSMYKVSYTREWNEGLAQKRIDGLISMIPELKEGHTIHVDVFIAKTENQPTLSPWHAKKENGGIDIYKEVETQRKIFKYWRERGFDVTGEGVFWAHPPGEGFYGLQPMSWWYPSDIDYQMETPEYLSARGRTDREGDGDFRFGSSMHGEEIFLQAKKELPGFLGQFCRTTLAWYFLARLERMALIGDTLYYSNGVKASTEGTHNIIRKGEFILRDNDDLFVPALWNRHMIIAYSEHGYNKRSWKFPDDWQKIGKVDLYKITLDGPVLLEKTRVLTKGKIELSLEEGMAVYIVPSGN